MIMPTWLAPACAAAVTSPKSATLTSPVPTDQHVLRLDVAVHETEPVRLGEPGEHRLQDGERGGHAERAPGAQHVAQRAALDQLHDEEQDRSLGPESSPWSWTSTTAGWSMRAAERASRSKRMRNAGSAASRASMILMATGRSSRVSMPR